MFIPLNVSENCLKTGGPSLFASLPVKIGTLILCYQLNQHFSDLYLGALLVQITLYLYICNYVCMYEIRE